jgi:hypothetical protein
VRLLDSPLVAVLPLLLAGCFKPYSDFAELDFSDIAFDNPNVTVADARVASVDSTYTCPDGEPARVFGVYRTSWDGPRPTAVLLHSGAFDYIMAPEAADPLAGESYRQTTRLSRPWSLAKAWETMGINPKPVDVDEANGGTLVAALVEADIAVVVPANCWGDLWHNVADEVDNDIELELVSRDGLGLASGTLQSLVDAGKVAETGIQLPFQVDDAQLFLIGLGEGGRGVGELLHRTDTPDVAAVLVDSSPDLLSVWERDPVAFAEEAEGLARLFGVDGLSDVDDHSLRDAIAGGLAPARTGVAWSSIDPRLPTDMIAPTADAAAGLGESWVIDTAADQHIQLNADPTLSAVAAAWLSTGDVPAAE